MRQNLLLVSYVFRTFGYHVNVLKRDLIAVHRSLSGNSASYLADDCRLVADDYRRSTESRICVVTRTHSNFDDRAFAAAGPSEILTYHTTMLAYFSKCWKVKVVTDLRTVAVLGKKIGALALIIWEATTAKRNLL